MSIFLHDFFFIHKHILHPMIFSRKDFSVSAENSLLIAKMPRRSDPFNGDFQEAVGEMLFNKPKLTRMVWLLSNERLAIN